MEGANRKRPSTARLHQPLPRDDSAPGRARGLVRQLLGSHQLGPEAVENASLVVSELVTNALKHGRGAIELLAEIRGGRLLLEVVDQGEHPERVRRRRAGGDGGWGLHLVDALAARWGVYEGTTHVWAEVPL